MTPAGANAGRVRARRCAVQALYQWQMAGHKPSDILKEFVAERELVKVDLDYFATLTSEIPKRIELLQGDIATAIDREWLKIGPVERSVILIGAYEMRFCPNVPWRVVINEAVELCKMFGAEEGHRYINGVLDKLARHVRPLELSTAVDPLV